MSVGVAKFMRHGEGGDFEAKNWPTELGFGLMLIWLFWGEEKDDFKCKMLEKRNENDGFWKKANF